VDCLTQTPATTTRLSIDLAEPPLSWSLAKMRAMRRSTNFSLFARRRAISQLR